MQQQNNIIDKIFNDNTNKDDDTYFHPHGKHILFYSNQYSHVNKLTSYFKVADLHVY